MSVKTANTGHFTIPTAPAAGTSVTSGSANAFSASYVQLIASTGAAIYITGIHVESAAALAATYIIAQLATGTAGNEAIIGQYLVPLHTGSTVALGYRPIFPPIPVATSTRIAVKTADSVGSKATLITLECINQANVVDDGIAVGTVTTVTNQLTAAAIATGVWGDTTAADFTVSASVGKSVMNGVALGTGLTINAYTGNTVQTGDAFAIVKSGGTGDNAAIKTKTDFLPSATAGAAGGVFIAGTNAATTITTGLTTTFTGNLTGSVASVTGAAGSVTGAVGSVTGAVGSVTGAVGSVTGAVGSVTGNVGGSVASVVGAVGSVTGLTASNLDATISSRLASASYTAPDNTSVAAVKVQTDKLAFTVANKVDSNILSVNGTAVNGDGSSGNPWGP